jgi:LytS/YehU family sensor histidine kinase
MTILIPNLRKCEFDKSWKEHLVDCFYLSIIGVLMGYYFCSTCYQDLYKFFVLLVISGGLWISQWKGHSFIHDYLDRIYPWFDRTGIRVFLTVIQLFVYPIVSITFVHVFAQYVMGAQTQYFTKSGFIEMNLSAILIGTFITLFSLSSQFLQSWRQAEINAEKLKAAHISSQFETLKNQVNPHFLFNSLNVLTNLVYEDQDTAAKFIKQLSQVYRYVLESREKNLVTLDAELEFLEAYTFLQSMRFGKSLQVNIQIAQEKKTLEVPPMSIQLLIENAIKHNIVSKKTPLEVDVYIDADEMLVVKNNVQRKNILKEESSGIGLKNITERYKYLSKRVVEVKETGETFMVSIPVLAENDKI